MNLFTEKCRIDQLSAFYNFPIDVLRLDLIHPTISGNKWFKLKEYLKEAKALDKKTLLTFGGPYSNHIVATAAAAEINGLQSIGIIRGEKPAYLSTTLEAAISYGMKLYFLSREAYKQKEIPLEIYGDYLESDTYVIPEGGYGRKGMFGVQSILLNNDLSSYSHLVLATGTGTTLAGLVTGVADGQKMVGISALKNNYSLQQEINDLLPENKKDRFQLSHDYHFGGYAKHTMELINFMNEFYSETTIPTDFVYTGKAFYAAVNLIKNNFFSKDDKLLLIHTGGLQGNNGLRKGTLIF